MDNNEQWKSNGNCDICRRRKYCGKMCTAAVRRRQAALAGLATTVMVKAMGGYYNRKRD